MILLLLAAGVALILLAELKPMPRLDYIWAWVLGVLTCAFAVGWIVAT